MADEQLFGLFSPQTGQQIQAVGAALGGTLPQFRQTQALRQQGQQKLSDERKRAMLVDNRGVRRLLEGGNVDRASQLLQNRITEIDNLGGDPSDTSGLLTQLQNDPQGALSEVIRLDNFAVDSGLLDAFPVADTLAREKFEFEQEKFAAEQSKTPKRDIFKDVDGISRFVDTGEAILQGQDKRAVEIAKKKAEKLADEAAGKTFDDAKDLRGEFTKASGEFVKIRDAFKRIQVSAKDPSAAGDLALIFNYMKMLDPGSVVRESEFATAANAAGVPDRIRNTFNRILRGERLATDQRADFVDRANSLFAGQSEIQDANTGRFTRLSQKFDIDPDLVVFDLSEGVDQVQEQVQEQVDTQVSPQVTTGKVLTIDDLDNIIARGVK